MLLWFGYVEFYSLFVLSIAIFTITGCSILNGLLSRWFILPALVFSTFLHIFIRKAAVSASTIPVLPVLCVP